MKFGLWLEPVGVLPSPRKRRVRDLPAEAIDHEAMPSFGVAHRVGPGRDAGEVVARVVAQEGLEEGGCGGRDEVGCEIRDADVSEACGIARLDVIETWRARRR